MEYFKSLVDFVIKCQADTEQIIIVELDYFNQNIKPEIDEMIKDSVVYRTNGNYKVGSIGSIIIMGYTFHFFEKKEFINLIK